MEVSSFQLYKNKNNMYKWLLVQSMHDSLLTWSLYTFLHKATAPAENETQMNSNQRAIVTMEQNEVRERGWFF